MARGKYTSVKRGGGRNFSKNLQLDENGTAFASPPHGNQDGEELDEDGEEGSDDGEELEEVQEATSSRKAEKKPAPQPGAGAAGDEVDPDLVNPNHAGVKTLSLADVGAPRQISRREKEQQDKKEAKERYWKLHQAGETDEAKSDLARLAKIRKEREEAQAKRKAESEAKAAEIEAKKKAQKA